MVTARLARDVAAPPVSDRDIYLVVRRAVLAIIGIFDRKYAVGPAEK